MLDATFAVITILFFAVAAAYAYGCERLRPRGATDTASADHRSKP